MDVSDNRICCSGSGNLTYRLPWRRVVQVLLVAGLLLLTTAGPAAAQTETANPVCQDESDTLANMIEGFLQITTGLGIMGLLVVWQADTLMNMLTYPQDQRGQYEQHRRSAMQSAATLVVLGPLFAVAGSVMDLPIAQCVDLIPF
jgi:hypothetical protein